MMSKVIKMKNEVISGAEAYTINFTPENKIGGG
jgi:hypothetical protein